MPRLQGNSSFLPHTPAIQLLLPTGEQFANANFNLSNLSRGQVMMAVPTRLGRYDRSQFGPAGDVLSDDSPVSKVCPLVFVRPVNVITSCLHASSSRAWGGLGRIIHSSHVTVTISAAASSTEVLCFVVNCKGINA